MTTKNIQNVVAELTHKLAKQIDNGYKQVEKGEVDDFELAGSIYDTLTQLVKEVEEGERGRMREIVKSSYLMTNGYKDTDTTRTCMYIPNEKFNIEINKRLDFFLEALTPPTSDVTEK